MKGINDYLNSIRGFLKVEDSFAKHFENTEFLLNILGLNIIDPNWFWNGSFYRKAVCISYLGLVLACSAFAFICAIDTYKGSLEDQLSSLLAAFFTLQVSK